MNLRYYRLFILTLLSMLLISCGGPGIISTQDGPPSQQIDVSTIPNAIPQQTKRSKYGNPKSYVVFGKRYYVMPNSQGYKQRGIASWYGSKFHGKRTSSGEPYDMHAMTAAHKTLPLPTYVKVSNLKNGRQVILKVNDRGPFHNNRVIDLSHTAAVKLGIKATGTGLVEVEAIEPDTWHASSQSFNITANNSVTPEIKQHKAASLNANLYLQLGAFASSQNAHNLKNKVNHEINSNIVNIFNTLKNNQQFYRVRIGPISSVKQADELAKILTQKGFGQPQIIID